ncbi:putative bifunctional diguanylate cyclase/phosphodiesterase [Calidifontibacillus erzurumensis]|uniref:putative bifunctional diguanylate cyclase/phosphodiesterase n=1 Tax=Calidifontibacillus erzurumensis TaxID=2741433 RepID=UPI0035B54497
MAKTGSKFSKMNGILFAIFFTIIYFIIGTIGIIFVDFFYFSNREWIFLLITLPIMFYIAYRFIYRSMEQIEILTDQQLKLTIYKSVFDQMNEGLVITNAKEEIIKVNPSFTVMTGYREDEVIGKTPAILSSGLHSREFYDNMKKELRENGRWQGEIINQRKNGQFYPEQLSISEIRNLKGEITHYIGVFTDMTHQRKAEGKIEFLTHYDTHTKLPKYNLFMKHLHNYIIENEANSNHQFSLFIVDTAKLKALNAAYGYKVGDELLQTLAIRLQNRYKGLLMGRLNSKEFAILNPHLYEKEAILKEAEDLIREIELPFYREGEEFFLSATIGIGIFPEHGATADELYKNATLAKTAAKEVGSKYQLFGNELLSNVRRKILLEKHLNRAIEMNELELYYQPQIDIQKNHFIGLEVLLRWNHTKLGMISPDEFIPIAEETNLIIEIGEWVLEQVCLQIKKWEKTGIVIPKIAVNLSPKQFQHPEFLTKTQQIIQRTNICPSFLEFEITENMSFFEGDSVIDTMNGLKELGIKISVDDFGKGYSNLSYLQQLPIDSIKIDRSFISHIPDNKQNTALTKAIIAMAHELELTVVAEGVEKEEQIEFLHKHHCNIAQGYYYSKPLSTEDIITFLKKANGNCQIVY